MKNHRHDIRDPCFPENKECIGRWFTEGKGGRLNPMMDQEAHNLAHSYMVVSSEQAQLLRKSQFE